MTFTIHYSILGYLCFRESDAQRERLKAILDLNRSRYASSSNVFFDPPTVHFALTGLVMLGFNQSPFGLSEILKIHFLNFYKKIRLLKSLNDLSVLGGKKIHP
jgi:hypothetical protein